MRAITEQMARIGHTGFNYANEMTEAAARDVLAVAGLDGGRCVFLCSGSEAVEYGVRVASQLIERRLVLTMADSYFGAYGAASQRPADAWHVFDWMPCGACPYPGECDAGCPRWATIPHDEIGAFLFEPGSSSGFVHFPPAKLIRNIVAAVRRAGGLVLVNEVTTGIGRTGAWFGYQHYDFTPDIVAMGKGIGNGYPVSVAAFAPAVVESLGGQPIKYSQSHQNDPLGAAVVRAVIQVIREEKLIERGREIGAALLAGLHGIAARTGQIAEVRARGLMLAIELSDDAETTLTIRTHRELVRRGFVTCRRPGTGVLRLDPALTVEREDIDAFLVQFEEILSTPLSDA